MKKIERDYKEISKLCQVRSVLIYKFSNNSSHIQFFKLFRYFIFVEEH